MAHDAASQLYQAFVAEHPAAAIDIIERARRDGMDQAALFDRLFTPAMALLGAAWASGAIDEYGFAQASVVAEQVTSFVIPPSTAADTGITVLVGTMRGDHHAIGRSITASALKEAGHRVIDLGVDVRPADFLERAEETGARVVVVFAQMIGTARSVVRIREMFTAGGREDVVIFVSGGPFSADEALARSVGANGVARGAESALRLVAKIAKRVGGVA